MVLKQTSKKVIQSRDASVQEIVYWVMILYQSISKSKFSWLFSPIPGVVDDTDSDTSDTVFKGGNCLILASMFIGLVLFV